MSSSLTPILYVLSKKAASQYGVENVLSKKAASQYGVEKWGNAAWFNFTASQYVVEKPYLGY